MKQTQKSQSLFSAIVARIANKFKSFPENRGKIVENRSLTPNERNFKMIENQTDATESTDADAADVAVVDGPVEVRTRKGKKGPGKLSVIVPNKADADTVVKNLKETVENGTMVFTKVHEPAKIVSAIDWLAAREVLAQRATDRAELLAGFSPEQLALLNL